MANPEISLRDIIKDDLLNKAKNRMQKIQLSHSWRSNGYFPCFILKIKLESGKTITLEGDGNDEVTNYHFLVRVIDTNINEDETYPSAKIDDRKDSRNSIIRRETANVYESVRQIIESEYDIQKLIKESKLIGMTFEEAKIITDRRQSNSHDKKRQKEISKLIQVVKGYNITKEEIIEMWNLAQVESVINT